MQLSYQELLVEVKTYRENMTALDLAFRDGVITRLEYIQKMYVQHEDTVNRIIGDAPAQVRDEERAHINWLLSL